MSETFSPKKQPNPFSPEARDRALELLRNPFSIAVLASLGLHGLMFAVLPMLSSTKPQQLDPKQTVGVVELNPLEQMKLPEFANPQVPFSPPTTQTKKKILPPPSTQKQPPSLLDSGPIFDFPTISLKDLPAPPPLLDLPLPKAPRRPLKPVEKPKPLTQIKPPETRSPEKAQSEQADSRTATRTEKIPQDAIDQLIAMRDKLQKQGITQPSGGQSSDTGQAGDPTKQGEAYAKLNAWLDKIATSENIESSELFARFSKPNKEKLSVACPSGGCVEKVQKLPTPPSFIVAVNPDGKILNEPLQVVTGDKDMDQAAVEELKKFETTLKPTGKLEFYQVAVQFQEPPTGDK